MTMPDSDNAIHNGWTPIEQDVEDLFEMPTLEQPVPDEPDGALADPKPQGVKSRKYEKKMRDLFKTGFHITVRNKRTQADAATILMYGPDLSKAVGDLAEQEPWVAKAIDMLTETTDNAAMALVMAAVPFITQVVRNHEPVADIESRGIKVPFTKRVIHLRFNFPLWKRLRIYSHEPEALKFHVFNNESVAEKMRAQGLKIDF
jgi:hypothetical protein